MSINHEIAQLALAVNEAQFALGNECFNAAGGTFIRNVDTPTIRDANHVALVDASTPDEINALFERAEREFAHAPHRAYHCDFLTPPEFEARLTLENFAVRSALVSVLDGELLGDANPFDIRPVESDDDWLAFERLHAIDWQESRRKLGQDDAPEVGVAMARTRRLKSPPAKYYLGYIDDAARGYFSTLPGLEGMAQVEDLFVDPAFRHRGLATALIHHTVRECHEAGAERVVIVAEPSDTPKHMYAAMGFRPVGLKRDYWKLIAAP